jgi:hypothetical protein
VWNDPQGLRPRKTAAELNPFSAVPPETAAFKITHPADLAALFGTPVETVR